MKILTLNTHSIIEDNYERKFDIFTDAIFRLRPDVIAMQEVNQSIESPFVALGDKFNVRRDNHALRVCKELNQLGLDYNYFWRGIKLAYGKFEEGVAIITNMKVTATDCVLISKIDDVLDWHTRYALGVKINDEWFYSIHTNRYDDAIDPFYEEWQRFETHVWKKEKVWVMGDFNTDAKNEEYKKVMASDWYDTFSIAEKKDDGTTVRKPIDGWRDEDACDMRIDYILTNRKIGIKSSEVIFNGLNEEVVSDHFGILVEV